MEDSLPKPHWLQSTITHIVDLSSDMKLFRLSINEPFEFLSGQWIDLYLPKYAAIQEEDEEEVREEICTGYSMVCTPEWTLENHSIELIIKYSQSHLLTKWMMLHAQIGNMIKIHGPHGQFYFREEMAEQLMLIGGGIGATPLLSIFRKCLTGNTRVVFVHTAKSDRDKRMHPLASFSVQEARNCPHAWCLITDTNRKNGTDQNELGIQRSIHQNQRDLDAALEKQKETNGKELKELNELKSSYRFEGRITAAMIKKAISVLSAEQLYTGETLFFLSGPPSLVSDLQSLLINIFNVPSQYIKYEKW